MNTIVPNWEDIDIRRENGRIQSATLRYNIFATEGYIADELLQNAPGIIFGNLYRTTSNVSRVGPKLFEGVVEYEYKDRSHEFTLSFDTFGGMPTSTHYLRP